MSEKISIRKAKFIKNAALFRCPKCKGKMTVRDYKDMVCLNGHCYDISRTGYINFLLKSIKTEYDKEMFQSRKVISDGGFFDPMLKYINEFILNYVGKSDTETINIFDAGCGEGSHLGKVISDLRSRSVVNFQGVGIDISKEGILLASKSYFDIIWCVADLANLPFMEKQFNVILNILSPSNYEEFGRVLKADGVLIKVVPGSDYLKELRTVFFDEVDKQTYSNEKVIEHYRDNFNILDIQEVLYTKIIDKNTLVHLMRMTPLSWTVADEKIKKAYEAGVNHITAHFTVIIGKKYQST